MSGSSPKIQQVLAERGHTFFAEPDPPRAVTIRAHGTVLLVDLDFGSRRHHAVAKPIPPSARLACPEQLVRIHSAICTLDPELADCSARFLGFDRASGCVLMEYFPGESLGALMQRALCRPGRYGGPWPTFLERAAHILTRFHKLRASAAGIETAPQTNGSFQPSFEASWHMLRLDRQLPASFRAPEALYRLLPAGFAERTGDALIPYDAHPRNILVDTAGGLCFIDLDYGCGNPAFGLAQFLVSLDRKGIRGWFAFPRGCVADWKRAFAVAYLREMPGTVAEDLLFFYPWALVRMLERHIQGRPWFRGFLIRQYAACLHQFLVNLERHGAAPAQVFS